MKKNKFLYYWKKKDENLFFSLFLKVLSFFYLSGYLFRKTFYQLGLIKVKELKAKVISVGNITLGGSGKTPFTLYLAKKLKERGRNFAILIRGYKRRSKTTEVLEKLKGAETIAHENTQ